MKIDPIDFKTSLKILKFLKEKKRIETDYSKNILFSYTSASKKGFIFRPPVCINLKNFDHPEQIETIPGYILLLIQTGNAAIGLTENGKIKNSKIIRRYMVRQKQGKSQLSYLKTKGKSRAGSRIRLRESRLFFEDINSYLSEYKNNRSYNILYSCTPLLWGLLFDSRIAAPYEKESDNWLKIPFYVNRPNQKELSRINYKCQQGSLEILDDSMNFLAEEINHLT